MNIPRKQRLKAGEDLRRASTKVFRSAEEACGFCLPHRAGGKLVLVLLGKVLDGVADPLDMKNLRTLGLTMSRLSRCSKGRDCGGGLLKFLDDHLGECAALVREDEGGVKPGFDMDKALNDARRIAGREPLGGDHD